MNHQKRVMLLIDADNVSADVIDQAVAHVMAQHGAIHVRRAYCTAESALANLKLFKRHSIRPIVNLSTGKNSTDISLAVDAIDLVLAERPEIVVVVSSDSDFAPLVIRLREKGCRVEGVGQLGKTGEDSKPVYDAFIDLTHGQARDSASPSSAPRKRAAAAKPAAPKPTPAKAATSKAAAAKPAAPAPAAPAPREPLLPDAVADVLAAVPDLWRGGKIELGVATEQLRAAKLLAKSAPSTRLFKKFPSHFALTPEMQPNKVQYVGPRVV